MVRLLIFAIGSAGLLVLSWPCLRDRRSHGCYRFFAFEAALALVLLNVPVWFRRPFSPPQIASWLLLLSSAILVVHGFSMLRRIGRPEGDFENTTVLVTSGAYRYIRHPLYGSLLLLAWGAFLKHPSVPGVILAGIATAALIGTARVEERENLARFGADYADYMTRTKMFLPFLF